MVKKSKRIAPVEAEAPAVAPTTEAPAVAKKARYAPKRFGLDQTITMLVTGNPKRSTGKSAARFAACHSPEPQTVREYIARSVELGNKPALAHNDLRWDAQHGFIEVK
jgi:hypothetical protein